MHLICRLGRVKIARHSKSGKYAAIKIVSKTSLVNSRRSLHDIADTERILLGIEREIVIMKLIDHPNIMRLYDVWETSGELYLILEYIEGGELFDYICEKGKLPSDEALDYFQQLIGAIDYCHRFNIAHRDLKPENLLLDTKKRLKVADFGMAAWQSGGANLLETACGSPHYAAPEVVRGEPYDGSSADIWSCGVILFALLAGRLPFDDEDILKLLDKVKLAKFTMPTDLEPGAKDLISRMLEKDVSKRINMAEILEHPWYTSRQPSCPAAPTPEPPTLESLSLPVAHSVSKIDSDILGNLRTLWNGATDEQIIAGLVDEERTWEKAVYRLLMEYRRRCVEEWEAEEEARRERATRRERKKQRHEIEQEVTGNCVSRPDPPTPRRAATQRRAEPTSRPASRARAKTISGPNGPPSLPSPPEIKSLRPVRQLPSPDIHAIRTVPTGAATTPSPFLSPTILSPNFMLSPNSMFSPTMTSTATPASPLWDALSSLALPPVSIDTDAPELQDESVQRFFRQIVERMNGMQGGGVGTPGITELLSPVIGGTDVLGLGINIDGGERAPTTPTAPLKIAGKGKDTARNKENGARGGVRSIFRRPSSAKNAGERSVLAERRVQILLPPKIERLRKGKGVDSSGMGESLSDDTQVASGKSHSNGSSSASSSSSNTTYNANRRSWFANLFKPRTHLTHVLRAPHAASLSPAAALDAAELILIGVGAKVGIVEVDGVEMLRCEMEEKKDPAGIMEIRRALGFRVEARSIGKEDTAAASVREEGEGGGRTDGTPVEVALTYEKGSMATFRFVCRRMDIEWRLGESDEGVNADPEQSIEEKALSPIVGEGGRFVEAIGALVV